MSERMLRLLVVGEALVDIVQRADGSVEEAPGGSPANTALALGRLGRRPTLLTRPHLAPSLAAHPLPVLLTAGIAVTIGSDDPPMFNTTFNDEVALLGDPFGLDIATIDEVLLNGIRHSFLPADRKRSLEVEYRAELDALKVEHLA